ncbi:MAG: hypothetical protein IPK64_18505 [bacterium]|nr:hypothetical protein [bacterium]
MGAFKSAGKSELFPDFPLNPQNLFRLGEPIQGQSLADAAEVGRCICAEFLDWMAEAGGAWPPYATAELSALTRAFEAMNARASSANYHNVDSGAIRRLARDYVRRLRHDRAAHADFMAQRWTLYNATIDFGNTIACGGTLQTILQHYS